MANEEDNFIFSSKKRSYSVGSDYWWCQQHDKFVFHETTTSKYTQDELDELHELFEQEFRKNDVKNKNVFGITWAERKTWSEYVSDGKTMLTILKNGTANWSLSDLIGVKYYANYISSQTRDFSNFIEESKKTNLKNEEIAMWKYYAEVSCTAFKPMDELLKNSTIFPSKDCIIAYDYTPESMRPQYFIYVDHNMKSVVVIFRGTQSLSDVITDLHATAVVFSDGYSHRGMHTAAKWFNKNIKITVRRTLKKHPGYKLMLLGHSLGAGTAAILSVMWKKEFPSLKCLAFACPPVMNQKLAESTSDFVTSFINGDDVIVRLSIASLEGLRVEITNYDWKKEMEKDLNNSSFGKLVYSAGKKLFGKKRSMSETSVNCREKSIDFPDPLQHVAKKPELNEVKTIEQTTETYSITLYPAGKIYQLRTVEGRTYVKEAKHSEYERIILSNSCISDHRMQNYTEALLKLEIPPNN